jgi:DNA-binding transcriptional ArsR family regulator
MRAFPAGERSMVRGRLPPREAFRGGIMDAMADERGNTRITDPQVMRALAHPARIEIMEHLASTGVAVTATECARLVGLSPSATSYHLRELARYGLIEQAPSRGDGRERVWRSTNPGISLDGDLDEPEARDAEKALVDAYLSRDYARLREWWAGLHNEPKQWRDASALMSQMLLLTAEELTEVTRQVREVLGPYQRRDRLADPPPGARTVVLNYAVFPVDQLGGLAEVDVKE